MWELTVQTYILLLRPLRQIPTPAASLAVGSALQGEGLCQSFVVALEKGGREVEKIYSWLALIANWAKFQREQLRQRRELRL